MKKTIILAALLGVFSITNTFAQTETKEAPKKEKKERAARGDNRPNPMADLNLSADQENKMKALNEEGRTKAEAIRNDASLSDDDKRAKMMEMRKAQNEKRLAILTPEQKKKWEQKMKERGGERNGNGRGKEKSKEKKD